MTQKTKYGSVLHNNTVILLQCPNGIEQVPYSMW